MRHRTRDRAKPEMEIERLNLPNLLKFGSVCSSLRSSASPVFKTTIVSSLLIKKKPCHNGSIWIFSPSYGRPYHVKFAPGFNSGKICGFSNGWIVVEDDNDVSNMQCLRLFSSSIMHLLPLPSTDNQGSKDRKVCLSADQSVVIAIHRDREDRDSFNLYFCRPKSDLSWKVFTIPHEEQTMIEDVIFYSGKFYAITSRGVIAVIDPFYGLRTTVIAVGTCFFWTYLAQSSECGLILVNISTQSKSLGHWIEKVETSHSTDEAEAANLRVVTDIGNNASVC